MSKARGVLFVHSSPAALCPHVEWAAGAVFGAPVSLTWTDQPAQPGLVRAEYAWVADVGTAAALASALGRLERIRFEATEEPTSASEGVRYSYTPRLGLFFAVTGLHGDVMLPEDRVKNAVLDDALGVRPLQLGLDALLGGPWDAELEPFRYAGEGAPVRWLHKVV